MSSPNSTTFERPDIGMSFSEVDLESVSRGYIGLEVAPIFDTPAKDGTYPIIPKEAIMEERETKRAPKGGYARGEWEFEQGSYRTQEHGAEELIDDNLAAQYRYALDFDLIVAARAMGITLRGLEKEIADALFSTSTFGNTAVSTPWSSHNAATPIDDVKTEIEAFEDGMGVSPNALVMPDRVLRDFTRCAQVIDQVKYSGFDDPKLDMRKPAVLRAIAELLEVDKVVVPKKMRNSANKGQSVSYSKIWNQTRVGLFRVAMSQDLEEPCVARTFHWGGDGSAPNGVFESYRDESKRSNVMRFRHERKLVILQTEAGRLLTGVRA